MLLNMFQIMENVCEKVQMKNTFCEIETVFKRVKARY